MDKAGREPIRGGFSRSRVEQPHDVFPTRTHAMHTTSSLVIAGGIGLLSGAHAAIWGMYKDSIYEGFSGRSLVRSMIVGVLVAIGIQSVLRFSLPAPSAVLMLFGIAYAAERGVVEVWKTFIRDEDQSKYFISMTLTRNGVPVESRGVRLAAGVGYVSVVGLLLFAIAQFDRGQRAELTMANCAFVGLIVGLIIAAGGAWKDAPKEGFQLLKFFRSPMMTVVVALLLSALTDSHLEIAVAAIGYERATVETYKTFLTRGKAPGKFFGKPVRFPEMRIHRRHVVPVFLTIWTVVLFSAALAARERWTDTTVPIDDSAAGGPPATQP